MFHRLIEWCVPASALQFIGKVNWRIEDGTERRAAMKTIAAAFEVSPQLLNSWDTWMGPYNVWKRWPSFDQIIIANLNAAYDACIAGLPKFQDQLRGIFSPDPESGDPLALELRLSVANRPVGK